MALVSCVHSSPTFANFAAVKASFGQHLVSMQSTFPPGLTLRARRQAISVRDLNLVRLQHLNLTEKMKINKKKNWENIKRREIMLKRKESIEMYVSTSNALGLFQSTYWWFMRRRVSCLRSSSYRW